MLVVAPPLHSAGRDDVATSVAFFAIFFGVAGGAVGPGTDADACASPFCGVAACVTDAACTTDAAALRLASTACALHEAHRCSVAWPVSAMVFHPSVRKSVTSSAPASLR